MSDNENMTNEKPQQEAAPPSAHKYHPWRRTGIGILIGLALAAFIVINPLHWSPLSLIQQKEESETGLWTCGMHPHVIQDTPGLCPICNMNLVPLKRTTLGETVSQAPSAEPKAPGKKKIKYWVAPMDPTYISDKPGKSPMGMDLVPVYESEEKSAGAVVTIDPITVQNIGVKSQDLVRGDLAHTIRTVGILDYNDKAIYWVTTKYDGWIQKVYVNYVGEQVTKGLGGIRRPFRHQGCDVARLH